MNTQSAQRCKNYFVSPCPTKITFSYIFQAHFWGCDEMYPYWTCKYPHVYFPALHQLSHTRRDSAFTGPTKSISKFTWPQPQTQFGKQMQTVLFRLSENQTQIFKHACNYVSLCVLYILAVNFVQLQKFRRPSNQPLTQTVTCGSRKTLCNRKAEARLGCNLDPFFHQTRRLTPASKPVITSLIFPWGQLRSGFVMIFQELYATCG